MSATTRHEELVKAFEQRLKQSRLTRTTIDDDYIGCGIALIWANDNDMYNPACNAHDKDYIEQKEGSKKQTLTEVDSRFLENMKIILEEEAKKIPKISLKNFFGNDFPDIIKSRLWYAYAFSKMYLYYGLARVWGLTIRKELWS